MMTDTAELLTSQQVAELTGRSRITVLVLRERYDLGRKMGRDYFFTQADVDFIRSINPLGGRPPKSGIVQYTKTPAEVHKGPKKQPASDT